MQSHKNDKRISSQRFFLFPFILVFAFFMLFFFLIYLLGSARITFDFKAKELISLTFNQLEQSYYHHMDIPFFIVVVELWIGENIEKKIFVTVSKNNKQDSNYVLDSLNYILSFQILENVDTIYLVSDNANNLKNGKDLFNMFS
jgi:hypothetical protein